MAVGVSGGGTFKSKLRTIASKTDGLPTVRVGFLENASYPHSGVNVAMVAAFQEFGAPRARIPPRPFMRPTIAANKKDWGANFGPMLKANDFDVLMTLGQLGEIMAGQFRQAIINIVAPPLSPVTLMLRMIQKKNPNLKITGRIVGEAAARVAAGQRAKGVSIKPLVMTGHLLNSIGVEVVKGKP